MTIVGSIAVVGANGYVGQALCRRMEGTGLVRVTRKNYEAARAGSYDVLVNCAMPSKRFWARENPALDFLATVERTADLVYGWRYKKFVQVSSVSARCQPDTAYGRHKAAAEVVCGGGENLVVRLGPLYSRDLKKGVLCDIRRGRVYVAASSRYAFTPLEWVADWVACNLDESGTVEVGARGGVELQAIADHLKLKVEFSGPVDDQLIVGATGPDARVVLGFMEGRWDGVY
jgi:dTDP-4-dehydrorhamnose reductase